MGAEPIIIHIDTEKSWRGGQQQVAYLVQGLIQNNIATALICQPGSALEKYAREKSLPCHSIRMLGELDIIAGLRIACLSRRLKCGALHLHSAHALSIGLWTKLFNQKLKLIAVRRVDFHINKNLFSKFKYTNRFINKIICISEKIQNVLIEDGVKQENLTVIHSGIDTIKHRDGIFPHNLKSKLGIPDHHTIVGTVAAMAGHKDYPNLLKAAKVIMRESDTISFVAVGDGPEKDKIMSLAEQLQLGKRFYFTGFQKNIGYYLNNFDIFVMASKREGMGTSILDAQSVGLPVIACATGGIPEIVEHGYNGLLVPPKDENALARAIMALTSDNKMQKEFSENALRSVQHFTIEKTVQKNLALYNELLSERMPIQ